MNTPGTPNYKEAIIQAYLAGRGNANIHVVTSGHSALSTQAGTDPVPNIVGPSYATSQRQRMLDAESTLNFLTSDAGKLEYGYFDGEDGFHSKMIHGDPDRLKRTRTTDVAARAKRWKEALDTLPFKTDISQIIGAAFVTGMVSPLQTSPYMAVNRAMIQDGDNWIGKARTFKDLAAIKKPEDSSGDDFPQREALQYFASFFS